MTDHQANVEPVPGERQAEEVGFADDARGIAEEEERGISADAPAQPQDQQEG